MSVASARTKLNHSVAISYNILVPQCMYRNCCRFGELFDSSLSLCTCVHMFSGENILPVVVTRKNFVAWGEQPVEINSGVQLPRYTPTKCRISCVASSPVFMLPCQTNFTTYMVPMCPLQPSWKIGYAVTHNICGCTYLNFAFRNFWELSKSEQPLNQSTVYTNGRKEARKFVRELANSSYT